MKRPADSAAKLVRFIARCSTWREGRLFLYDRDAETIIRRARALTKRKAKGRAKK